MWDKRDRPAHSGGSLEPTSKKEFIGGKWGSVVGVRDDS